MKNLIRSAIVLGLIAAAPLAAQAQTALTKAELIQLAVDKNLCQGKGSVEDAFYTDPSNASSITITCTQQAGFAGSGGTILAVLVGTALLAAAGSSSGTTSSTTN